MRVVDGPKALYIHLFRPHQVIFPHLRATSGPPVFIGLSPLSALAPMRWRTACRCLHAAADRAMRWWTVGDAMADRGRGVHAAADRDCKNPARVPGGENADFIPRRIPVQ